MTQPTDEMERAFEDAAEPCCHCGDTRAGLAAVLAIVERDHAIVDPADLRTVLDQRSQHAHRTPGRWDADGSACTECAARNRLRAALTRTPAPGAGRRDCPPVPEIHTETGPASTQAAETGTAKGTGRVEPPTRLSGPLHRTKLGDLIIEHGPFTAGEWISGDIADVLMTAAAVNELREELIAARKASEERQQFRVYVVPFARGNEQLGITCDRPGCGWHTEIEDFTGLAELNRRASEHAEVCR
jgi:hypothetical protein